MARQQQVDGRQEGSRWINRPPTPEEFAKWFRENVFLHEGMDHAPFLPGITLIPNTENVRVARVGEDGVPAIGWEEQLAYTPYPMVDARLDYWWKWRLMHPEWEAKLDPVVRATQSALLPEGFWQFPVHDTAGKETPFIAVTYDAIMAERGRSGAVIVKGRGTKVVPLLTRTRNGSVYPDENAIAKAETGAKGRALGAAGILVIPGAGIATAEDMLDFLAAGGEGASPALPPVTGPSETAESGALGPPAATLGDLVDALRVELREFPASYEEARAWAREKGFDIETPPEQALRGLERMLSRKVAHARRAAPPTAE